MMMLFYIAQDNYMNSLKKLQRFFGYLFLKNGIQVKGITLQSGECSVLSIFQSLLKIIRP